MSGRIKLADDAGSSSADNQPALPEGYYPEVPTGLDAECGTFGLNSFALPLNICPDRFVCGADGLSTEGRQFATCVDAMNCAMLGGMTTNVAANDVRALFMHQMIPHHENAVNMCKALVKGGGVECDDLTNEDDEDCVLRSLCYEIINNQNFQIQTMLGLLEGNENYGIEDNCDVELITAPVDAPVEAPVDAPVEAPVDTPVEAPVDAPVELPVDVPVEVPTEAESSFGEMLLSLLPALTLALV